VCVCVFNVGCKRMRVTRETGLFGSSRMCFDAIGEARATAERLALFGYGVLIGECFKLAMDRNNISPLFSVTRCEEAELAHDTGSTAVKVYRLVMQGQQAVQPLKVDAVSPTAALCRCAVLDTHRLGFRCRSRTSSTKVCLAMAATVRFTSRWKSKQTRCTQ
jgi:hypothetical protein